MATLYFSLLLATLFPHLREKERVNRFHSKVSTLSVQFRTPLPHGGAPISREMVFIENLATIPQQLKVQFHGM